jgi:hypothetical protein
MSTLVFLCLSSHYYLDLELHKGSKKYHGHHFKHLTTWKNALLIDRFGHHLEKGIHKETIWFITDDQT